MLRCPLPLALILAVSALCLASCAGGDGGSDALSDAVTDSAGAVDAADAADAAVPPPTLDLAAFREPPAADRPWVRWWWPGDDVEDAELRREVAALAAAGFGGAEIQPFDAALDPEAPADVLARRRSVPSASHTAHLLVALDAAAEHGLRLDLTLGSGWPTGGAHVAPADSMTTLVTSERLVEGPASLSIAALAPSKPPFYHAAELAQGFGERLARWMPDEATVVAVLAYEVAGGFRSPNLFDIDDTLELDASSVVDLTDRVTADGGLTWDVPEGRWAVIAFFSLPDGEYVQLAALPDPETAFVVDHFDADAVAASLPVLVPGALEPYMGNAERGGTLRGLFVDSFELKTERIFTDDFLAEFERRRGYDLLPLLPAVMVPGADNFVYEAGRVPRAPEYGFDAANDEQVRLDYRETLSELFVERFVQPVSDWAVERGMLLRLQPYGLDIAVLAAAGAADVPEAEQLYAGGSDLFVKLLSSAAHLYDTPGGLVSAESFVWILRDHMATPLKMKAAADKLFTAGVNHLVYHGFPYDVPQEAGDFGITGWAPFSSRWGGASTYSDTFGERTPIWERLPAVNRYVARCQHLLRQGSPAVDVAVVYPWYGFPTSLPLEDDYFEPLLGGWLPEAEPLSREVPFADLGALFGPPQTDPRVAWLKRLAPLLADLEEHGVTWEWVDPERLADATRSADGRYHVGALDWRTTAVFPADGLDRGDVLLGDGLEAIVLREESAVGILAAVNFAAPSPLRLVQRAFPGGARLVFFHNPTGEPVRTAFFVLGGCPDARWLDPWTGAVTDAGPPANETPAATLDATLDADLPPYGSAFLACGFADLPADEAPASPDGQSLELALLSLTVDDATPAGEQYTAAKGTAPLGDWREIEDLRHARGPARYAFGFSNGARVDAAWVDVGWVFGAATATLDGEPLGDLLIPPFRLAIGPLEAGRHDLEITLVPPLRNHLVGLGATGDERYRQFADKEDTLVGAGLAGPVTLTCSQPSDCRSHLP